MKVCLVLALSAWAIPAAAQAPAVSETDRALALATSEATAGRRAEAEKMLASVADRHQSVRALLQLARLQAGDANLEAAMATIEKARALAPNAEEVLGAYAQLSLAAHQPAPAIRMLEALTRMCPAVAEYHYLQGVAWMQAGDFPLAIESLTRAQQLEPDRPLTLVALGLALNNRKRFGEAKSLLRRSLELEPESLEATAALAESEEGLNEIDSAEAHARQVLAKSPGHGTANLVLGLVLMERQRYPEARDALLKASADQSTRLRAHYQLSLVYARLGDEASSRTHLDLYREALRDLERRSTPREGGGK